jgi:replication factor C subunit 1
MWVDKYKPQRSSDLIGSTETMKKLSDWLKSWEDVHVKKTRTIPFAKENPGAKAALISGPPGIGKTSIATILAKEFGYEVLELNASDTRNKKLVSEVSYLYPYLFEFFSMYTYLCM